MKVLSLVVFFVAVVGCGKNVGLSVEIKVKIVDELYSRKKRKNISIS